jgi:type II secretory pathway pseudopilin PulG
VKTSFKLSPVRAVRRQRGLSIVGLIILVVIVGFLGVVVLRVVPTFVEYRAIQSAVRKAHASANSIVEIQKAFDRSAAIDDITQYTGKDLDITKVDDDFVITFAYTKKIPLFGPVSLTIDYSGGSKAL